MKNLRIEQIVKAQRKFLEGLDNNIKSILSNAPRDNLNIHKRNNGYRFEIRSKNMGDDSSKSIYLSRESKEYKEYAAKYCAKALEPAVKKALAILDTKPESYDPEIIFTLLAKFEQIFGDDVPICFETKKHYIDRWSKDEYKKNPFPLDPSKSYTTERGEVVRSKNELLCVNFVYSCGLSYRADAEIKVKCGKSRYPDLIILNPKNLREEYHEIMGRMSDPDYVDENIIKIREYEATGFRLGERLHIYFESEKTPFDFEYFKSEIRRLYL